MDVRTHRPVRRRGNEPERVWRKVLSFAVLPLVSAIAPILVLPVVVRSVGAVGWASIAIGMSIGAAGSVVVNWGWGVLGPPQVAPLDPVAASDVYRLSYQMRLALCVPTLPICWVIAEYLDHGRSHGAAGVMALAFAIGGLSPAWFYIGRGRASQVALWDSLPRIFSGIAAVPLQIMFPRPITYPIVCLSTWFFAWSFNAWMHSRHAGPRCSTETQMGRMKREYRRQAPLVGSGIVSAGYTSLSVAIVSAVNYPAVAVFAGADRFRAMAKQGQMGLTNGFQGWVAVTVAQPTEFLRRVKMALYAMTAVGVLSGIGFALLLPSLSSILFGDALPISFGVGAFMGLTLFLTALSMWASFHVLAPLGRPRPIAVATICGSIVGIPALVVGTHFAGATGAAAAVTIAELVVVAIELPVARKALHSSAQILGLDP